MPCHRVPCCCQSQLFYSLSFLGQVLAADTLLASVYIQTCILEKLHWKLFLQHTYSHDTIVGKGGIAYQDDSRRPKAVADHKRAPHRQPSSDCKACHQTASVTDILNSVCF
jgi:hypothetical protein